MPVTLTLKEGTCLIAMVLLVCCWHMASAFTDNPNDQINLASAQKQKQQQKLYGQPSPQEHIHDEFLGDSISESPLAAEHRYMDPKAKDRPRILKGFGLGTGKVWHIKHFCCTDCKVPLGGQQYIIVDQSASKRSQPATSSTSGHSLTRDKEQSRNNLPYCLSCFDRLFGETCEQCGKLITCDLGAINHEQRCWHASGTCFKCYKCSRSLIGRPFLPASDGRIYCSLLCCEQSFQRHTSTSKRSSIAELTLASYSNPRASTSPLSPLVSTSGQPQESAPTTSRQLEQLLESLVSGEADGQYENIRCYRQLIDYLSSAGSSVNIEQVHKLLIQLKAHLSQRVPANEQERKFICDINQRLQQLHLREPDSQLQQQLSNSRNPPSLPGATTNDSMEQDRRNRLNPFLLDCQSPQPVGATLGHHYKLPASTNPMNDKLTTSTTPNLSLLTPVGGGTPSSVGYMNLEQQTTGERKLLEHSTSNAGPYAQQMRPRQLLGTKFAGFSKASQCSPAASIISNEGTMSDQSATSSGVSTAPPASASSSLKSHSPLSVTSSHCSNSSVGTQQGQASELHQHQQVSTGQSIDGSQLQQQRHLNLAATLERRRRVQPITELSVVELLSAADEHLQQSTSIQTADGFNKLVSQFKRTKGSQDPHSSTATRHQPESFFNELAQRLPPRTPLPTASSDLSSTLGLCVATGQLDTNGLPTMPTNSQGSINRPPMTDHYSTVNKSCKTRATDQQHVGAAASSQQQMVADNFFAITSPLLSCHGAEQQPMRPTSSLSTLFPATGLSHHQDAALHQKTKQDLSTTNLLQPSYSTNSLNSGRNDNLLQPIVGVESEAMKPLNTKKPAKSVSFDQSVKDPPSSCTMTLGRATTLKSALKQSGWRAGPNSTLPPLQSGGSLSAYTAYYDEHGRRVRLSSLFNQPPVMEPQMINEPVPSTSKSIFSNALSILSGGSSRGGRREERKMRQQQHQMSTAVQTQQPMSNLSHQQLFVQPHPQQSVGHSINLLQEAQLEEVDGLQTERSHGSRIKSGRRSSARSSCSTSRRHSKRRGRHSEGRWRRRNHGCDCSSRRDYECSTCSEGSASSDSDSGDSDSDCSSVISAGSSASSYMSDTNSSSDGSETDNSSASYSSHSSSADSSRSSSPCSSVSSSASSTRSHRSQSSSGALATSGGSRSNIRQHRNQRSSRRHSSRSGRSTRATSGPHRRRRHSKRSHSGSRSGSSRSSSSRSRSSGGRRRSKQSRTSHSRVRSRRSSHSDRHTTLNRRPSNRTNYAINERSHHHSSHHSPVKPQHHQVEGYSTSLQEPLITQQANVSVPSMTHMPQAGHSNTINSYTGPMSIQPQHYKQHVLPTEARALASTRAKSPSNMSTDSKGGSNEACKII